MILLIFPVFILGGNVVSLRKETKRLPRNNIFHGVFVILRFGNIGNIHALCKNVDFTNVQINIEFAISVSLDNKTRTGLWNKIQLNGRPIKRRRWRHVHFFFIFDIPTDIFRTNRRRRFQNKFIFLAVTFEHINVSFRVGLIRKVFPAIVHKIRNCKL